jgi:4-hydroxy-3-polyprenylbenzoate decarboxylase
MTKPSPPQRLIIGIAGASGVIYGIRALEILRATGIETHLVMSPAAELTMSYETDVKPKTVREMASVYHPIGDVGASISSGSFHTMSEIAHGITSNLLSRAADVVLKERRRLVLGLRETPLHTGHMRTMLHLSEIGAIVAPIVPAFYTRPKTLDEMIDHSIGRMLDLFGIDMGTVHRWKEPAIAEPSGMPKKRDKTTEI